MYAFDSINANILIVSSNHFFVSIDRNIGPLMPILAIFKMTIRCTKPFVKSMLVFEKKKLINCTFFLQIISAQHSERENLLLGDEIVVDALSAIFLSASYDIRLSWGFRKEGFLHPECLPSFLEVCKLERYGIHISIWFFFLKQKSTFTSLTKKVFYHFYQNYCWNKNHS